MKKYKSNELYVGIILSIIFFIRFLFLNADVKTFAVVQIQPIDELYYNEIAVKIYKYGLSGGGLMEPRGIRKIVMYFIGIMSGVVACEIVSLVFFQQHVIKTIKDTLVAHGGKIGGVSLFKNIGRLIRNSFAYWKSNVFKYTL